MPTQSRQIVLKSRPEALPTLDNFALETVTLPDPGDEEIQVRNHCMSVDPYMRGRMRDTPSYVPPFQIGQALEGGAVGTVTASNSAHFAPGDTVLSMFGWRESFNVSGHLMGRTLSKIDTTQLAPELFLGAAGLTGLTAWHGLLRVAALKAGDTVFISAAAGAVGSVACQIASLKGATVIASAGGPEKCAWLRGLGEGKTIAHVIDYKAEANLTAALAQAAPQGIDVYFDNVGGPHLEAALANAKPFARFALCGAIADYNQAPKPISGLALAVGKRLRLEGFIVSDHFDRMPEFLAEMTPWLLSGQVANAQTMDRGLENAPAAFLKLFTGGNRGKMLVQLP